MAATAENGRVAADLNSPQKGDHTRRARMTMNPWGAGRAAGRTWAVWWFSSGRLSLSRLADSNMSRETSSMASKSIAMFPNNSNVRSRLQLSF